MANDIYVPYEIPFSLWELITREVLPSEEREIKEMLGESLVEQSLELHTEISLLLDIWHDYRDETEETKQATILPEPPQARERLCQEINFFVSNIRERSSGSDPIRNSAVHNSEVIDYVMKECSSDECSRPSTARSTRSGRETPMRKTPSTGRGSVQSSLTSSAVEDIVEMADKLNYLKFGEVVEHLRELITQEVEQLKEDIEFLQKCLDGEADFRSQGTLSREPTLTELRSERSQLEKQMLNPDDINNIVSRVQTQNRKGSAHERQITSITRQSSLDQHMTRSGVKPMKAAHDLAPIKTPHSAWSSRPNLSHLATQVTLNGNEEIMLKPAALLNSTKLVKVGSLSAGAESNGSVMVPKPPNVAKSTRPSSANRFRQMVIHHREDT